MAPNQLPAAAQAKLGLPDGFKTYSPFPLGGINLQSSPIAIGDQEFSYIENFLRLGDGYLRTVWDVGSALYTAVDPVNNPIVSFFAYTINVSYYFVAFHTDGSAVQIPFPSGTPVTTIGGPGTFYNSLNGQLPACSQWGTLYLLISNRNTRNDYWAWDGTLLYSAGSAAPRGVIIFSGGNGYTSNPTVTPYSSSGFGSSLAIVPSVNAGSVVNLETTNPGTGYRIDD